MGAFPKGFIWGTATAAHQVEGGNVASDLWPLEMMPGSLFAEPSGDACDHYHLYQEDMRLLKSLGFQAYRFSVEWARIEPEEGFFSKQALDHYRRMIATCKGEGLIPIVTFHHFTAPLWFSRDGGWENKASVDRFAHYCERAARAFGDLIDWACTINEANVPMLLTAQRGGLSAGEWTRPRQIADVAVRIGAAPGRFAPYLVCDGFAASPNLIAGHRKGYGAIKSTGAKCPVGITLAMQKYEAVEGGEALRDMAEQIMDRQFLESVRGDDFVGVQTYTRILLGPNGLVPAPNSAERTQMGYEFYPEALEHTIRLAAKVSGCPVLVTENGIGTEEDTRRIEYARRALEGVARCLADGIDVRGYIHWSMMDNYEWFEGYRPKFGLVEVNRETQARKPKPSAYWLGDIARRNAL
jgi:beta-glucosidase